MTQDIIFSFANGEEALFIVMTVSQTVCFKMLSSVGFRCRKELTNQFEGKQRPDIAVYDYVDGEKLWLDITIAHPFAKQYITKSFTNAGYAAAEREKAKNMKYL